MFEAKKANATMHTGAGNPISGMKTAKVSNGGFGKGVAETKTPVNTAKAQATGKYKEASDE